MDARFFSWCLATLCFSHSLQKELNPLAVSLRLLNSPAAFHWSQVVHRFLITLPSTSLWKLNFAAHVVDGGFFARSLHLIFSDLHGSQYCLPLPIPVPHVLQHLGLFSPLVMPLVDRP
jgi:hypothetical protein